MPLDSIAKPYRVPGRVAAGVVVEVRVDRPAGARLLRQTLGPCVERGAAVAAAVFLRTVKAGVDEWADAERADRRTLHVVRTQRDAVTLKQRERLLRIPRWFAEFDDVTSKTRQHLQEDLE